jgi:hypothetical protein
VAAAVGEETADPDADAGIVVIETVEPEADSGGGSGPERPAEGGTAPPEIGLGPPATAGAAPAAEDIDADSPAAAAAAPEGAAPAPALLAGGGAAIPVRGCCGAWGCGACRAGGGTVCLARRVTTHCNRERSDRANPPLNTRMIAALKLSKLNGVRKPNEPIAKLITGGTVPHAGQYSRSAHTLTLTDKSTTQGFTYRPV